MKLVLKIMFIVFLIWMGIALYLLNTDSENATIVMGLGIVYLSFLLMPIFIYHRYKGGKYKKYILNDQKLMEAFGKQGKK